MIGTNYQISIFPSFSIVKKGVEAEQQPQPVLQQEVEEPHGGPTAGTPLEGSIVQQQPAAKPTSPVLQNYPFYPSSRGLYAYINGRQYLLQNVLGYSYVSKR